MFTGLKVESSKTSVSATTVQDLKSVKAFHDNQTTPVMVDLDELIESLDGGFDSPNIVADLEDDLEYTQRELEDLQGEYDGVYEDLQTAENEATVMSIELDQLSGVEDELIEAQETIESLEQEIESLHQEINDMEVE